MKINGAFFQKLHEIRIDVKNSYQHLLRNDNIDKLAHDYGYGTVQGLCLDVELFLTMTDHVYPTDENAKLYMLIPIFESMSRNLLLNSDVKNSLGHLAEFLYGCQIQEKENQLMTSMDDEFIANPEIQQALLQTYEDLSLNQSLNILSISPNRNHFFANNNTVTDQMEADVTPEQGLQKR